LDLFVIIRNGLFVLSIVVLVVFRHKRNQAPARVRVSHVLIPGDIFVVSEGVTRARGERKRIKKKYSGARISLHLSSSSSSSSSPFQTPRAEPHRRGRRPQPREPPSERPKR